MKEKKKSHEIKVIPHKELKVYIEDINKVAGCFFNVSISLDPPLCYSPRTEPYMNKRISELFSRTPTHHPRMIFSTIFEHYLRDFPYIDCQDKYPHEELLLIFNCSREQAILAHKNKNLHQHLFFIVREGKYSSKGSVEEIMGTVPHKKARNKFAESLTKMTVTNAKFYLHESRFMEGLNNYQAPCQINRRGCLIS